jgi:nucleotide-binding universal stress UspA family protein
VTVFTHIVVANDGSEGGFKALAMACDLAKRDGATLEMISVEVLPNFPASIDEVTEVKDAENHKFHDVQERALQLAAEKGVNLTNVVVAGHAAASIVAHLKVAKADPLVVGFMGHSALYERIIGGTADRLVRLAPCPVMVVN